MRRKIYEREVDALSHAEGNHPRCLWRTASGFAGNPTGDETTFVGEGVVSTDAVQSGYFHVGRCFVHLVAAAVSARLKD